MFLNNYRKLILSIIFFFGGSFFSFYTNIYLMMVRKDFVEEPLTKELEDDLSGNQSEKLIVREIVLSRNITKFKELIGSSFLQSHYFYERDYFGSEFSYIHSQIRQ